MRGREGLWDKCKGRRYTFFFTGFFSLPHQPSHIGVQMNRKDGELWTDASAILVQSPICISEKQ